MITSLCWCILDVWFLSYFSNCANENSNFDKQLHAINKAEEAAGGKNEVQGKSRSLVPAVENVAKDTGFLDKILPSGKFL